MFRINVLYLTLSILGLISFYSCGPIATVSHEECTTALPYEFTIPVKTVPNRTQMNVNDTITVLFDFDAQMVDATERRNYNLKDFKDFYPAIRLFKLDGTNKNPFFFDFSDTCHIDVDNLFIDHYTPDRATRNDAGLGFDFKYNALSDKFTARISYVMYEKGIYYFKINSESKREFTGSFPGKCNSRPVDIIVVQQTDGNFDLVKSYIYPNGIPSVIDDIGKSQYENEGGYAFEVK